MMSDNSLQAVLKNLAPTYTAGKMPTANRSAATMDAIKGFIIEHGLHPGDLLPTESRLCEELGVSRSSVREALRKLEALDIVTVRQGRGSYVGNMSLQPMVETLVLRNTSARESNFESLREVVATRKFLDLGIASELVALVEGTENPDLEELVSAMVTKAKIGQSFLDEDIAFHQGILRRLENELVSQLTSAVWLVHQAVLPELPPAADGEMLKAAQAHGDMLRTAQAGDLEGYVAAVHAHYAPLERIIAES